MARKLSRKKKRTGKVGIKFPSILLNKRAGRGRRGKQPTSPSKKSDPIGQTLFGKVKMVLIVVALLMVVFLTFFYRGNIASLNDSYIPHLPGDFLNTYSVEDLDYNILFLITRKVDNDHRFIEQLYVVNVDERGMQVRILAVPTSIGVEYSKSSIPLEISHLYNLGASKEPREDITFVSNVLDEVCAIRFDRYVALDMDGYSPQSELDDQIKELDPVADLDKITQIGSSLFTKYLRDELGSSSRFDRLSYRFNNSAYLFSNFNKEEFDEFQKILADDKLRLRSDFVGSTYLRDIETGEGVLEVLDKNRLDVLIRGYLKDIDVEKEQARVEIYNGTGKRLFATNYSRYFENASVDVTRVGTTKNQDDTVIFVQSEGVEENLKKIKYVLRKDPEVIAATTSFASTGDIVVILGSDMLE